MGGIGIIVNPRASGNKRRPGRVARFESIVGDDGEVIATSDLAELDAALVRFRDDRAEIVAVCGGDGSFFHVISRMVRLWGERPLPLLLPLRAGTINNLARTIGARRRCAESMLAHVIKDYRQGRTHEVTERNLICVNGEHYGYIVGAGLITNFLRLYYSGRKPGPLRAFGLLSVCGISWIFGTSLIGAVVTTIEADVECDGEHVPYRGYTMILASSVAHIGLGVKPFYLSARKRGYYHLLAGSSTAGQLLGKLWRFFRGFPADLDNLYDNVAAHVVIEFAEPQPYTINGEILDPVRVLTLEPGPRVSFVRG
ncbi:MAG: hypothetical protein E4H03_00085 [Myxococcales bacterium]|jgi:diacylglycerol kinase family enzyme|nr:MAG: hypothetical protein E4H03_00085 [Myxococcales bacterium]